MGDDDNFKKQKLSGADRTREKYENDTAGFSLKDQGIDGFVRTRKCTDILCLIVFFAFLVSMGACAIYGTKHGQIEKLLAPLDGDNNFCGHTAGYEKYPALYISNLEKGGAKAIFQTGVCVKKCPQIGETVEFKPTGTVGASQKLVSVYNGNDLMNYCIPKDLKKLGPALQTGVNSVKAALLQNPAGKYFNDMYLSSRAIYASFGMGVVYCLIYIYLMSAFAEVIAWVCVALAQLGFIGLSVGAWFYRASEIDNMHANKGIWDTAQNDASKR